MPTDILLFTLFTFDKPLEKCVKRKEASEIPAHSFSSLTSTVCFARADAADLGV